MLECSPESLSLEQIVACGRERAERVLIATADGRHLWAGTAPRPPDVEADYTPA